MTEQVWVPADQWYASLPSVLMAAGGLITDSAGDVLVVKPNYRDHWGFPGGMVDENEQPDLACSRELQEEVGLTITPGPLLVVGWVPPVGDRPRPMLYLFFDCGTLADPTGIRLQTEELDEYAFLPPAKATALLDPLVAGRLPAALRARETGRTEYVLSLP